MWIVKKVPNQTRWIPVKPVPVKRWSDPDDSRVDARTTCPKISARPPAESATLSPKNRARRIPASGEPLAFCARCGEWTPMRWLPKEERGHAPETWFECEYCGCRELRLRYLAVKTAVPMPSINQTLK